MLPMAHIITTIIATQANGHSKKSAPPSMRPEKYSAPLR